MCDKKCASCSQLELDCMQDARQRMTAVPCQANSVVKKCHGQYIA